MSLSSELNMDVIRSFENLSIEINKLNELIVKQDADLPCWFQLAEELKSDEELLSYREEISIFLSQLEYTDNQPAKEILLGPGWIACTDETLKQIDIVNKAKLDFKKSIIAIKSYRKDALLYDEFEKILNKRPTRIKEKLSRFGLSRLHLKQCYRQIPVLPMSPYSISWTWANTKAITKISKEDAISLMERKTKTPEIIFQINKLHNLSDNETLAIVQTLAPHLRANILFSDDSKDNIQRKMIKGAMPICFPFSEDASLPKYNPPKPKEQAKGQRSKRRDTKLEDEAFLPAIRAFRYKANEEEVIC